MSIVVDFPAPLGPRKATTSPAAIVKSMPRTAWTLPKLLCSAVNRIAAAGGRAVDPGTPKGFMGATVAARTDAARCRSSSFTHDRCHPLLPSGR